MRFNSKLKPVAYKVVTLIIFILYFIRLTVSTRSLADYDDPLFRERFSQFNCHKLKSCTPGPPKVCALNPTTLGLAEFEDKCTIYEVNCRKREFYKEVDMLMCESKKQFQESSLQFEPVDRDYEKNFKTKSVFTTKSTVVWKYVPGSVKLAIQN